MKTKILSKLFLFVSLGLIYITMKSDSGGKYNGGTSCGSCHGSLNTNTLVSLDGLPANYVTGTTYPLTFTIINSINPKAGFNIQVSGGIFQAGVGSKTNTAKNQLTHTAPATASASITTFSFSWTAPSGTAPITFNCVGNAVNDDNSGSSLDMWNNSSATVTAAWPSSVSDIDATSLQCYPNPATGFFMVNGLNTNAKNIRIHSLFGQQINANYSFDANACRVDCSKMAPGMYTISAELNGKKLSTSFVKN